MKLRLWRQTYETKYRMRLLCWMETWLLRTMLVGFWPLFGWVIWMKCHAQMPSEPKPVAILEGAGAVWIWFTLFLLHPLRNSRDARLAFPRHASHPRNGEFLLWLFLPSKGREGAIGDTNETFEMMVERFGPRHAKLWYWGEVARSAWPFFSYLGERLWKWVLLDWWRRHIS